MSWQRTVQVAELPVGEVLSLPLADLDILICRTAEDAVYAVEDLCSHDDGPLGEGELEGSVIECPRHGARFDVTNGAVVRLPAASALETFPTRIREGWIEVSLENS